MPRGDGTGPWGLGPVSGLGRGYCSGFAAPGFARSAGLCFGAGLGLGMARRFGRRGLGRAGGYAGEEEWLADEAELLEKRLETIRKRLSQLKGDE